ncbi:MAG: ABC transporter permease [Actinobacteria bacterium]|nr:ABC transporter permease [Actinomycetota bacterium]
MSSIAAPVSQPLLRARKRMDARILFGGGLLVMIILAAIVGPLVVAHDPLQLNLENRLEGPSARFPLGTDEVGRDILSRLLSGLRPALLAGVAAVLVAAVAGTLIGLSAAFLGGLYETFSMRVVDLLLAWPAVFLALGIVLLVGPGPLNVILAIGIAETPVFARLTRSIALGQLQGEHVEAARSMGASGARIMRLHILPFALVPLVVQLAIAAPIAFISEASLSFLGLGSQPPFASLGAMLSVAQEYLAIAPTYTIFPAAVIGIMVLSLTVLADGVQDALDPRHSRTLR